MIINSNWKKLVIIFVVIFFAIQFLKSLAPTAEEIAAEKARDAKIASIKAKNMKCETIRNEKLEIEAQLKSKDLPGKALALQRDLFIKQTNKLYADNKISKTDFELFKYVSSNSLSEIIKYEAANRNGKPISSSNIENSEGTKFLKSQLKLGEVIDVWIQKGLIRPYYFAEVIALGNEASKGNPRQYSLVIENSECFGEIDLYLAETLSKMKIKSGWNDRRKGYEFAQNVEMK